MAQSGGPPVDRRHHPDNGARRAQDVDDAIRALVPPDEYVTHYDLVVSTRAVDDPSKIRSHRYAMVGADPEVSLGKMLAAVDRLRLRLSRQPEADHDPQSG